MASTRYEVRLNGRLSERERRAFCAMEVTLVPAQTIVFGNLPEVSDLADLLALCRAMGLEVVSVRRLPGEAATAPGMGARAE
jgi:UDP-N-acetylglucosamine enolpyruvyl transferase